MNADELMTAMRQIVQASAMLSCACEGEATIEARNLSYALDTLMDRMDSWRKEAGHHGIVVASRPGISQKDRDRCRVRLLRNWDAVFWEWEGDRSLCASASGRNHKFRPTDVWSNLENGTGLGSSA